MELKLNGRVLASMQETLNSVPSTLKWGEETNGEEETRYLGRALSVKIYVSEYLFLGMTRGLPGKASES